MKISKKVSLMFLTVLLIFIYGAITYAVPAAGVQFECTQPNGDKFKAAMNGDEKLNWVTSETGEVIVKDTDKYWKYAKKVDGKLKASQIKYSKTGVKPVETIKNNDVIIQIKKKQIETSSQLSNSSTTVAQQQSGSTSLAGGAANSEKILVLLVQFSNINMKYTEAQWSNSFFGTTGSTVNSYYNEVSNGKFMFAPASETSGTANDGVIKVTLPYAHPNTGGNIGYANQKIVIDALTAVNPYINYADFDINGDGKITPNELHILTVVAGYETAYGGGSYPSVWAHSWATSVTLDGVNMSKYTQEGEIHLDHMATIGTACHELGHDLGLPDLYDYDGSSAGVGIHSLMASGSWAYYNGYAGNCPTHMDAWCKAELGYVTPTLISEPGNYTVKSFDSGGYNVLKVQTSNKDQYFLIENRELAGFDRGLSRYVGKGGIAVWHIDESILAGIYRVNDNEAHKGVDLEEANEGKLGYSQLDKNYSGTYDHYYSSANVTTFGSTSIPNSNLYDGMKTNISVTANANYSNSMLISINNGGGAVPLVISNVSVDTVPFVPTGSNCAIVSYTISKDAFVAVGVYDSNGTLVKTLEDNASKLKGAQTISWNGKDANGQIVGDGEYACKISAVDQSGFSATPVNQAIIVEKDKPVISNVSDSPDPYSGAANTYCFIQFEASENVYFTLKIYDSNNNLVRTMENNLHVRYGQTKAGWDGKDNAQKPCPNGVYTYKIDAIDEFNNVADEVSGTITIDRGAPVELTLYGNKPEPMKLNTKITYGITQPAYITLYIYDSNIKLVRKLLNNVKKPAGAHYIMWTGRNDSGAAVPTGMYKYTIEAEDTNGNLSEQKTGTINVDRTGPQITDLAISDNPFMPSGDNNTTISYNLSEDSKVTLNVFNSKNALIRTFLNKTSQSKGLNNILWNGKNKYDEFIPDGTYVVKVSAFDSLGNRSVTKSQSLVLDREAPTINNVSDSPEPFGVGNGQRNTIKYTLSEKAHVTINIYDNKDVLVKSLIDGDAAAGNGQALWNGTDSTGKYVEDGTYTYKINATDSCGHKAVEAVGIITTDKTPVTITNASINPQIFQASGTIKYTISKDAKVKIRIFDNSNKEIKVLENDTAMLKGENISIWDGTDNAKADVISGTYKYIINAIDGVGFSAEPVEGTITLKSLDKSAPKITNITDQPDPLKLGTAGAGNTISYELSEAATVTVKIYNSNNALVKSFAAVSLLQGKNSVEWDGKNDAGVLVEDGTYTYKINAVDTSGNSSGDEFGTITTDKTPITITNVSLDPEKFAISGKVNYTLSEVGVVTIEIYDQLNNPINTILNASYMGAGPQTFLWNGKDKNGMEVLSGNYKFIITAVDNVGFMATYEGTIIVDGPAPTISNLKSSPEIFIPTGFNFETIGYTISADASVTLKIYDSNENIVKTLLNSSNILRGENSANWDGKNDNGAIVADGTYTYKIIGVDTSGKASNEAVGEIAVDKTSPTITGISAVPNPIAKDETTTISYKLSEKASVSIKIYNDADVIVRTLEENIQKNQGLNSVIWDGKDSKGVYMAGVYTFKITATDVAKFTATGNGKITAKEETTGGGDGGDGGTDGGTDNTEFTITNVSDSPDPFDPTSVSDFEIKFTLSKDARANLKIYNTSGSLIETLINDKNLTKGENTANWNGIGLYNGQYKVYPDGVYTYKINATDSAGNQAKEVVGTTTINTDTVEDAAPVISDVSDSPDPFNPDANLCSTISYLISKDAYVTVDIYNSNGDLITNLENMLVQSGNNVVLWYGKNSNDTLAADGIYTYKINATDSAGKAASEVTGTITLEKTKLGELGLTVTPNPYNPNKGAATISFNLTKNASVSIEVHDINGDLIKTIQNYSTVSAGKITRTWDGKDANGKTVADGTYGCTVIASASDGTVVTETVNFIVKNDNKLILTLLRDEPDPFTPDGQNYIYIYYTISASMTEIQFDIYNAQGEKVVSHNGSSNWDQIGHEYYVGWNGYYYPTNVKAQDGVYTYKISGKDVAGNSSNEISGTFTIVSTNGGDNVSPVISEVSDSPDPFKPDGLVCNTINYTVSKDSAITIRFYNSSGTLVNTLFESLPIQKGKLFASWNGKNSSGSLVSDGVYTYKINAVDSAGNAAREAIGTITVDKSNSGGLNTTATPNPFNSNKEVTTISYKLPKSSNVTIEMFKYFGGITYNLLPVKTLQKNVSLEAGSHSITWDGTNEDGNKVVDGFYSCRLTAIDQTGNTITDYINIILDATKLTLTYIKDEPDPCNPYVDNGILIYYTYTEPYIEDTLMVYDSKGNFVWGGKASGYNLAIDYPAQTRSGWTGRIYDYNSGKSNVAPDGLYTFKYSCKDTAGNISNTITGTFTIKTSGDNDTTPPVISEVSDNLDPFSANGTDLSVINYTLSENAKASVKIYNSSNVLIRTLLDNGALLQGKNNSIWDGKDSNGILIGEGVYTYKINAIDAAGNKAVEVTGTITVDKTAPKITEVRVFPNPLIASGKQTVNIFYRTSEQCYITIKIYNSAGNLVKVVEDHISKQEGNNTSNWDATDLEGNLVPDGIYTYKIVAGDPAGNNSDTVTGTIIVDRGGVAPTISEVSDSPDPFAADGTNVSTISYKLSEDATVTLKLYNTAGAEIITLVNGTSQSYGVQTVTWDGKNGSGAIVSDGIYTYKITAVDPTSKSAQASGTINVDSAAPVISNFSANPNPFAPDGVKTVTIGYKLSESAKVTVSVLDNENNVLRVLEDGVTKVSGDATTLWDGTVNGVIVEDDYYRIKITAVDMADFTGELYGVIGIDKFNPQVIAIDDEPDPFNPNIDEFNTIHAEFSEWMKSINVKISDSSNSQVKGIDLADTIEFWWGWSGTDVAGTKVNDGVYTYKVNGTDLFGKNITEASGTITIDTVVPQIQDVSFSPELEYPSGTINYTLTTDAKVSVIIYDESNNLIATLQSEEQKKQGVNSAYWDGIKDGKYVGYGVYTYKITATSSSGMNALPATGVITFETIDPDYVDTTVDDNLGDDSTSSTGTSNNTANTSTNTNTTTGANTLSLQILNNSVEYYKIANGIDAFCGIKFTLSKDQKVSVKIYNSSNVLIKTLVNDTSYTKGQIIVKWNGLTNAGGVVPVGEYTYKISGVDSSNKAAPVASGILIVDKTTPVISDSRFVADLKTPSGTIMYTLSETCKVTITIYNGSNIPIRALESGTIQFMGDCSSVWDGKDSTGKQVNYGLYSYKIEAKDFADNTAPIAVGSIILDITTSTTGTSGSSTTGSTGSSGDTSQLAISKVGISPETFVPTGSIYYNISQNARMTIIIYDSANSIVKTLENGVQKTLGRNSAAWNGTNYKGEEVPDGVYNFRITGYTSNNIYATPVTGTITVERLAPTITDVTDSPDPFNIASDSSVSTISYIISENLYITIKIYDSQSNIVKVLFDGNQSMGARQVTWNGRDYLGNVVKDGIYTYKINAKDLSNSYAKEVTGTITVDTSLLTKIVISSATASPNPYNAIGLGGGQNQLTISYQISANASVTVRIYQGNTLVKTIYTDQACLAGLNTATWYGRNDSNDRVPEGAYIFKIYAKNSGGVISEATGSITVK